MYLLHNELNFIVMNNKHCIFLSGVAALVTLPSFAQSKGASEKPMNILYIMSDDHSFQTISAYDHRFIETPNIDRIGNEGVVFTNSFVANSISGPSRACMLTGKHSHKNGFIDNAHRFDGSQQTFPKLLQKAGYQTAIVGKWHLTSNPTGFDYWNILIGQGDYYNPYFIDNGKKVQIEGYATNITTDLALEWLENKREKEKPFCLLLHHKAPHRQHHGGRGRGHCRALRYPDLLCRAGHHHLRQRRCGLCFGPDQAGLHQRHRQSGGKREPVMSEQRAMQRLCGLMRKAVQDYEMLAPGDRVMVGVSGGKDSVALTVGLALLRQYIGFDYEVVAVTLDPQFDHQPMDYTALEALFARYGVPYEIRRTEIGPVVFEYRQEKNPCSLCAKLRRGALHTAAQELGCNKVALGHHLDDAVETFYMNLWRE